MKNNGGFLNKINFPVFIVLVFFVIGFGVILWPAFLTTDIKLRLGYSRLWDWYCFFLFFILIIFYRNTVKKSIIEFFTAKDHPLNLAVFRIVLFFIVLNFSYERSIFYAGLPQDLQFPPYGWENVLPILPISVEIMRTVVFLLKVFSILGIIGLFTRFSTIMTMILFFYAYGVTQFYGKINHDHHILWFLFVLCFSRCADVLSVDAILKAWRNGWDQYDQYIKPGICYALPIRFIWLLVGVLYFFPGFWKWWSGGIDWVVTDSLRNWMYLKWMQLDGWLPIFRVDQFPFMYRFFALTVILWEKTFILFLFSKCLRCVPVFLGLLFHSMTLLFMRINFITLQLSYVVFFNWYKIFNRIGRNLFKRKLYVLYNGKCLFCCKSIAVLRSIDILRVIDWVDFNDKCVDDILEIKSLNKEQLVMQMHAVCGSNIDKGFYAYRALSKRMPIFWPLLPFMYIPFVAKLAERVYVSVARCTRGNLKTDSQNNSELGQNQRVRFVAGVSVLTVFLLINIICGMFKIHSWPFSCYPTFHLVMRQPIDIRLAIRMYNNQGQIIEVDQFMFSERFGTDKLTKVLKRIHYLPDEEQHKKLVALFRVWRETDPALSEVKYIKGIRELFTWVPEERYKNPLKEKELFEINISEIDESGL